MSALLDWIDSEFATASGVGDLIELAQTLAKEGANVIEASHGNVSEPEARKRSSPWR